MSDTGPGGPGPSTENIAFSIPLPSNDPDPFVLQFTFGAEFEFHLLQTTKLNKQAIKNFDEWKQSLPANSSQDLLTQTIGYRKQYREMIIAHLEDSGIPTIDGHVGTNNHSKWYVERESLASPPKHMNPAHVLHLLQSHELCTRVLTLAEVQTEIPHGLAVLKNKFDVFTSKSSGGHIHIGAEHSWSIEFLRKFALVIIYFEEQFDGLHKATRTSNRFCASNRSEFGLHDGVSEEFPAVLMNNDAQGYAFFEFNRAENWIKDEHDELVRKLSMLAGSLQNDKMRKVNFSRYFDIDGIFKANPTIEFRQHQGTLDAEEIITWIRIVDHLVQWVESHSMAEIVQFLLERRGFQPKEFTTMEFLRAIDTPDDILSYLPPHIDSQFHSNLKVERNAAGEFNWQEIEITRMPDINPSTVRQMVANRHDEIRRGVEEKLKLYSEPSVSSTSTTSALSIASEPPWVPWVVEESQPWEAPIHDPDPRNRNPPISDEDRKIEIGYELRQLRSELADAEGTPEALPLRQAVARLRAELDGLEGRLEGYDSDGVIIEDARTMAVLNDAMTLLADSDDE
ncbi:MAG: hypothetical protein M1814_002216 [Vezdaea aestivalis]|nr:MAG: hypothetical protein M1814_002216 [Vezdaea aestivalis]